MENVIDMLAWKAKRTGRVSAVLKLRRSPLDLKEFSRQNEIVVAELEEWVEEVDQEIQRIFGMQLTQGQRLKEIRELFNVLPSELEESTGISQDNLIEIENGTQPLSIQNGVKLAIELTVDPLALLFPGREVGSEDRYKVEKLYFKLRNPVAYRKQLIAKIGGAAVISACLFGLILAFFI